ncbi:MAG: class I SAM-dependent methyltransferase [Brevundimonas sp.]|uniref:class I SAM-dependent methyltransferase n=1 Tax=Brevundimonas sp. TaxID=1871086 RepID=UPI002ABC39DD|nr:class I SAM-dependent methyltransferase [Brevundimonas sp.]MDZ4113425.1 class I SAM-dependent methyltransferase [Brevundimonas sp.]
MKINHLRAIADYWNGEAGHYRESHPEHREATMHPSWGLGHIPESRIGLLAGALVPGSILVEIGCGQGHDAVAFAELGLNVVAVDLSSRQLKYASPHPNVRFLKAAAERLPLQNASVDIVISDHGAFDHSPVGLLLSEASRILRAGGLLVVCTWHPLALICHDPATGTLSTRLQAPHPSGRIQFDGKLTGNCLSFSDWFKAFAEAGFRVERVEELRLPKGADLYYSDLLDRNWAENWPCDLVWVLRKPGLSPP